MFFRSEKKLFGLMASKARAASPQHTRRVTVAIESLEPREALSGLVLNPGVICGFNPQPDPPARSALVAQLGATTNGSAPSAPLHFEVPPGPC
jgi:hypothetical protein